MGLGLGCRMGSSREYGVGEGYMSPALQLVSSLRAVVGTCGLGVGGSLNPSGVLDVLLPGMMPRLCLTCCLL